MPSATPAEVTTQETTPTFQVRANLVLVRVVVRDSSGNPVGTLNRDDFQLFDNHKQEIVSHFNLEKVSPPAKVAGSSANSSAPGAGAAAAAKANPQRFLGLYFDDMHAVMGDLMQARTAAQKFISTSMQPTDRTGVFTSSGEDTLDFTDDQEKLRAAIGKIHPHAMTAPNGMDCPNIDQYTGYQIVEEHNTSILEALALDVLHCDYQDNPQYLGQARMQVQSRAQAAFQEGESQALYATQTLDQLIRRMTMLPGQRSIILASPGFLELRDPQSVWALIERALHANVVVNSLDVRGLFVPAGSGDVSQAMTGLAETAGPEAMVRMDGDNRRADVMRDMATGTGGLFFNNSNDLNAGFCELGSVPEYSYVLGFVPENTKLDGRFHSIDVKLTQHGKYAVQARRGYYAPAHTETAAENAHHDVEEAVFSDETFDSLPLEVHAQFFKMDDKKARINVLAKVDTKPMPFRKKDGRNVDDLTIVTVLFDSDGKYVEGTQKTLSMNLMDATRETLSKSGIRTRATFDVGLGTYQVRMVVRDSEGSLMSTHNETVEVQ